MPESLVQFEGKGYELIPNTRNKSKADPFTARVSSGGTEYSSLDGWSEWPMEDWTKGVGQSDPEGGGVLYGEVDTRFPKRLILPPRLQVLQPAGAFESWPQSPAFLPNSQRIAVDTKGSAYLATKLINGLDTKYAWIYGPAGKVVSVSLRAGTTTPSTVLETISNVKFPIDEIGQADFTWAKVEFTGLTLSASWLTIFASNAETIAAFPFYRTDAVPVEVGDYFQPTSPTVRETQGYTVEAGVWAWRSIQPLTDNVCFAHIIDNVAFYPYKTVGSGADKTSGGHVDWIRGPTLNTTAYICQKGTTDFAFALKPSAGDWTVTGGANITCFALLDVEYAGYGFSEVVKRNGVAQTGIYASHFLRWNGILYAANGFNISYTTGGGIWSGPFAVATASETITGLAPSNNGNEILVSTNDSLYVFPEGVEYTGTNSLQLLLWPSSDLRNGRGMRTHEGSVYIPYAGGLFRYLPNGELSDIWINREEDLPNARIGDVYTLVSMNNYLVVGVRGTSAYAVDTIWAYSSQGWHFLAQLPSGIRLSARAFLFMPGMSYLYIGTEQGIVFALPVPDSARNPLRIDKFNWNQAELPSNFPLPQRYLYNDEGFVEFPLYSGGLKRLRKDVQSVFIAGDIEGGGTVEVLWRDKLKDDWQSLGIASEDETELIFPLLNRPLGNSFQLGLNLDAAEPLATPVVRSIVTKFHTMVDERYRWSMTLQINPNQTQLDGTIIREPLAERRRNLAAALHLVRPVQFTDIDGKEYLVKLENYAESTGGVQLVNGEPEYSSSHQLTFVEA